jgi:hypothetical protein
LTADGNLGLGTTSPFSAANQTSLTINATTYPRLDFYSGGTQRAFINSGSTDTNIYTVGATPLTFGTNNTERARITSGGVLDIGTGAGAVGQIQFPATQVASANANTLDDYEEGTWTPKIGRVVTCSMYVQTTSLGSMVGPSAIYISGWPFPISKTGGGFLTAATGLNITAGRVVVLRQWASTLMRLEQWSATTGTDAFTVNEWSADGASYISVTYTV